MTNEAAALSSDCVPRLAGPSDFARHLQTAASSSSASGTIVNIGARWTHHGYDKDDAWLLAKLLP